MAASLIEDRRASYLSSHVHHKLLQELPAGLPPGRSPRPSRSESSLRTTQEESRIEGVPVPVLIRFYRITFYMDYQDHEPPHFHTRYQNRGVLLEIESGLCKGTFSRRVSRRALRLLFESREPHGEEFDRNWVRSRNGEPLQPIQTLP